MSLSEKINLNALNKNSENFVPLACHYDENSLLSKNGELMQIIEINGLHSEEISKDLVNLRSIVRESISQAIRSSKFAFWMHTIRRKANLDDVTKYPNMFSEHVHKLWQQKNYWHDKFVNRLYITVIHDAPKLKLKNFSSWVNSLSGGKIADFEEKYFAEANKELTETVDAILAGLKSFGAKKLGIRYEKNSCYSDPMFLFRRIMQLNEADCPVPVADISTSLASHHYNVGNDKIEVLGDEGKKFAALISIKEYQEVSAEALDRFLQIPVEMIATEVFYFVDKSEVQPIFKEQNYILEVSGDPHLKKMKGFDRIFSEDQKPEDTRFCHQQISFMVIDEDLKALDLQVKQASEHLAHIGIVHVREDINVEKTFWAQLPANFSFLARMKPTIIDNVAALASLHNFPTGHQYNPWGRAMTLLRTEKGTPYFTNFHDELGNTTSCVFGEPKTGRTTLMNFLLTATDKYQPATILITEDTDSKLYSKARNGSWLSRKTQLINPLICSDSAEGQAFLLKFFKIIARHYFDPLSKEQITILKKLITQILTLPPKKRSLAKNLAKLPNDSQEAEDLRKRLQDYQEGGIFHGIFEREKKLTINPGGLLTVNLQFLNDQKFIEENYPKEKKLVEQFYYDLNARRAVKAGIIYSLFNLIKADAKAKKIFAIDNLESVLNLEHYSLSFSQISNYMNEHNGIFFSTVDTEYLLNLQRKKISLKWIDKISTKFILPSKITAKNYASILRIDRSELKKLTSLTIQSRMFLIKQDNRSIASELSIGGYTALLRFLSCDKETLLMYKNLTEDTDLRLEDWVVSLYQELENR